MLDNDNIVDHFRSAISIGVKIFLPLLFPILLFSSKLGMVLKTRMLGQDGILTRPKVFFKDIAGLGGAKI